MFYVFSYSSANPTVNFVKTLQVQDDSLSTTNNISNYLSW